MVAPKQKILVDLLDQYQRILPRVRQYTPLVAHKIVTVLEYFSVDSLDDDREDANMYKIKNFPLEKFRSRIHSLLEFNEAHNTKWSQIDYLYESFRRGSYLTPKSFEKIYKNVQILESIWFTQAEVAERLYHSQTIYFSPDKKFKPQYRRYYTVHKKFIDLSPERNQTYINFLHQEVGMSNQKIKEFLQSAPWIFSISLSTLAEKILTLTDRKLVINKEQLQHFLFKYPRLLLSSTERLTKTIEVVRLHSNDELLRTYPVLFYMNPESEFFIRTVNWLHKGHKRYISIYERLKDRWGGKKAFLPDYFHMQPEHTEERTRRYIQKLHDSDDAQKLNNGEITRTRLFIDLEPYLAKGEKEFLQQMRYRNMDDTRISKEDKLAFKFVTDKIGEASPELYNRLKGLFWYTERYTTVVF